MDSLKTVVRKTSRILAFKMPADVFGEKKKSKQEFINDNDRSSLVNGNKKSYGTVKR